MPEMARRPDELPASLRIARIHRAKTIAAQTFKVLCDEARRAHSQGLALEQECGLSEDLLRVRLPEVGAEHNRLRAGVHQALREYLDRLLQADPDAWPELDRQYRLQIEAITGRSYPAEA